MAWSNSSEPAKAIIDVSRSVTSKAIFTDINALIDSDKHLGAVEHVARFLEHERPIVGLGRYVRKIIVKAPASEKDAIVAFCKRFLLDTFRKHYAGHAESFSIDMVFFCTSIGVSDEAYAVLRAMPAESKDSSYLPLATTLTCRLHLGALLDDRRFDEAYEVYSYAQANNIDCITNDDVIPQLLYGVIAQAQNAGTPSAELLPLLDPDNFARTISLLNKGKRVTDVMPSGLAEEFKTQNAQPAPTRPQGTTRKILVCSQTNWTFLRQPIQLMQSEGFEVRTLDFSILIASMAAAHKRERAVPTIRQMAYSSPRDAITQDSAWSYVSEHAPLVADLIEWSDLVFVDWWSIASTWLSRFLPQDKKLIIRCHSYEAFTPAPMFSTPSKVDGIMFIADHIRDSFSTIFSDLEFPNAEIATVPLLRDLSGFNASHRDARIKKTLGMTQYASANKDPLFAIAILEALLAHDPEWTLRFIGEPFRATGTPHHDAYMEAFLAKSESLHSHIHFDEFTDDIASWYASVGYILSTSFREGSHESIVEAMATGCIPVLRDWPMFKHADAARRMFPDQAVFDTPEEMARFCLGAQKDFDALSETARETAIARYDAHSSRDQFLDFLRKI